MIFYGKLKERKNLSLGEQIIYRDKISIKEYENLRIERKEKRRMGYK